MRTSLLLRSFAARLTSLLAFLGLCACFTPAVLHAQNQLISESFTSSAANFTVAKGGTWSVTGGKYVLTNPAQGTPGEGNGNISVHSTSISGDFDLSATVNVTSTTAVWNDASVLFGYQNTTNYYFVSLNESNDGNTSGLFKLQNGTLTQLADITTLITPGTTYTVKVERRGNTYSAYLNASLVASITDSTFTSGKVGFGTLNDGATFDDLVVTDNTVKSPAFSPAAGSFNSAQSVTLASGTSGASIRYTTDGSTPTASTGAAYTTPVAISTTTTLKAIAYKTGMADSAVTTGSYTLTGAVISPSTPFFSNPIPSQTGKFTVDFDAVPSGTPINAVIGVSQGVPTGYPGIAAIVRFNEYGAIDARDGGDYAAASSIPYSAGVSYHVKMVIDLPAHTYSVFVTPAGGSQYTVGLNYAFRSEQAGATALDHWAANVSASLGGTVTITNFAIAPASTVANPVFSPAGGFYDSPRSVTITTATSGATIRYTTNGSTPSPTSGTVYSSPITVASSTTLKAVAYKSGLIDSGVTSEDYELKVYGAYIPTRQDVGVTSLLSELTPLNNPTDTTYTVTTGGTAQNPHIIQGKIIYGVVQRAASHVMFINCLFRGPPSRPASEVGMVTLHDSTYTNWQFIDCTFAPQFPNANLDGIKGHEFKAFRCHLFWVVDGFGVFNAKLPNDVQNTRDSNVEIAGCLVEQHAYFPGPFYANGNGSVLKTAGGYESYSSNNDVGNYYVKRSVQQPNDMAWVDSVHRDGNHTDGVQVQGGYGRMIRDSSVNPATGYKSWSGTGIYIHGNAFISTDGADCTTDPSGLGLPVPGQSGSLANSRISFGDNPKRGVPQSPTMTRPSTTGLQLFDGGFAANGASVIVQQNVNQLPYPNSSAPNDYTVVVQGNYFDSYHTAVNGPKRGSYSSIGLALLYNKYGRNVYRYGSNPTGNPQIYPIRAGWEATTSWATADNSSSGLDTNIWWDETDTWAEHGTPLRWIPKPWSTEEAQEVRTSGIWYDDPINP